MNSKSIIRGLFVLAVAALFAVGGPGIQAKQNVNWSTGDLIAGQTEKIGTVTVEQVGDDLKITFTVTDADWCLDKTHVYVGEDAPEKAAPGQFPYSHDDPDSCSSDVYLIDLGDFDCSDPLYVAAHADVVTEDEECSHTTGDVASLCDSLPSLVTTLHSKPVGRDSFVVTTLSGGTNIDGTYEGWCIDPGPSTYTSSHLAEPICADSSFDLIEDLDPDNFDMVNYLLNLDPVGETANDGDPFTLGDMQQAIWHVLFGQTFGWAGGVGPWTEDHVDELVDLAELNGVGFLPACGELVAVALVADAQDLPADTEAQIIIVGIPVPCEPCERDETAWMWGPFSWKQGWGRYRTFEATCP